MSKKIIDLPNLYAHLPRIRHAIYHACRMGKGDTILEENEFRLSGEPLDLSGLIHNIKLLVTDTRWHWSSDHTPKEILNQVPNDLLWCGMIEFGGPVYSMHIEAEKYLRETILEGRAHILALSPCPVEYGFDIDPVGYIDMRPRTVLMFEDINDLVMCRMKITPHA